MSGGHSRTVTVGLLRDKIKLLQGHLNKKRVQCFFFYFSIYLSKSKYRIEFQIKYKDLKGP